MKIRQIEVTNFRFFERQAFNLSDQFTVFIGDNGTGKTAIIKALATGSSLLFLVWQLDNISARDYHFDVDDVRCIKYSQNETIVVEPQFPFRVNCQGIIDNYSVNWGLQISSLNYLNPEKRDLDPEKRDLEFSSGNAGIILKKLGKKVSDGEDVVLPLVALYGTNRLWTANSRDEIQTIKPGSRMRGYTDCLNSASNLKGLLAWFKTMELASLQRGKSLAVLDAVKAAIINCIEECESVQYDILEDQLMVKLKNNSKLPLKMLSDGFRTMLAMVADIAYRAAVLNPHLGNEAAQKTPGIVLIDEIDLHLHPKWQRRVVNDLRRTFPEIQFVATTHSPFIIQSLREGELINLDKPEASEEYSDRSIEDIAENVMDVELPQKSQRYLDMMAAAEEYYRVLDRAKDASAEEIKRLEKRLDELMLPYSDDPAYQAFLKVKREAARIGKGAK